MAVTLTQASLAVSFAWQWKDARDFSDTTNGTGVAVTLSLTNGTGAANANKLPEPKLYTIAKSATQQIDLAGVLTDFAANVQTLTKVKLLYVRLLDSNTSGGTAAASILIGGGTDGAGTNAFASWLGDPSDTVRVYNGGVLAVGCATLAGYAVTAGTGDILAIKNEDAGLSAVVQVGIAGVG